MHLMKRLETGLFCELRDFIPVRCVAIIQIDDSFAFHADEMAMVRSTGVKARRGCRWSDFHGLSHLHQKAKGVVYRGEGHGWEKVVEAGKYLLSSGMRSIREEFAQYGEALWRDAMTSLAQAFDKGLNPVFNIFGRLRL